MTGELVDDPPEAKNLISKKLQIWEELIHSPSEMAELEEFSMSWYWSRQDW